MKEIRIIIKTSKKEKDKLNWKITLPASVCGNLLEYIGYLSDKYKKTKYKHTKECRETNMWAGVGCTCNKK